MTTREQRHDRSRITFRDDQKTPQGGLALAAHLTRVGVFTYHKADGSTFRELRTPEEVFHPDALASFAGAPVTIQHPGTVTTDSWKRDAVGHVGDTVSRNGKFVAAKVRIQDAKAVEGVRSGDLVELSCGYTADVETRAGEHPEYGKYDGIQRKIRGNHVALLAKNQGRAGNEVRLLLDSADGAFAHFDSSDETAAPTRTDVFSAPKSAGLSPREKMLAVNATLATKGATPTAPTRTDARKSIAQRRDGESPREAMLRVNAELYRGSK